VDFALKLIALAGSSSITKSDWDKRRVKGVASSLFRIQDQKYSRALSTVIGGRWLGVVTDDEKKKLLLERGKL
jgi:chromosome segregation ATPase